MFVRSAYLKYDILITDKDAKHLKNSAQINAVATAVSPHRYTQAEILDAFQVSDTRIQSLFLNGWIEHRHLALPPKGADGLLRIETQGELLRKHVSIGLEMGRDAIMRCLEQLNAVCTDVDYLCCVSSTGFIVPGFSALLMKDLGFRLDCSRLDIVGMGCNAGLNGLSSVSAWASTHPGKLAIMVCIEVCSAAYVFDGTMRSSVVNSLFGDGAAAIAVVAGEPMRGAPSLLRFASRIVPDAAHTMRYDWDETHGKFSFFLEPGVPYVIGAHAQRALEGLLEGSGVRRSAITHWLVHSGGKKVIDSVCINLGLTRYDVRHTMAVLRNYGNVSSGSFLFSYERLLHEAVVTPGEYGVMMTMGPGATIEMALLSW